MKRILVTGAGGSAAANFIDSLRLAPEKFYIVGTDIEPYLLELAALDKRFILPKVDDPNYLEALNQVIVKEKIELVHPQPDPEVLFLSNHRQLIKAGLYLPAAETIQICQDKMKLIEILGQAKVNVATSFIVKRPSDLKLYLVKLLANNPKAWLRAIHGAGSRASIPIVEFAQAKAWIEYWAKMKGVSWGDFMVSEFLPGKEFAWQSLWQDGRLITSQARERIKYIFGNLTISGQTSSPAVAKTVHREDVNKIATKAVQTVDPQATGVFCVDLKEDKNGQPCVIEINAGRFFTTSNFLAHAGVNMPYYYIKQFFGEKLPALKKYNPVPADWYWVRMVDMGYKLIKGNNWTFEQWSKP